MLSLNKSGKFFFWLNCALLALILLLFGGNQIIMAKTMASMGMNNSANWISATAAKWGGKGDGKLSGDLAQDAAMLAMHKGMPAVYGAELNVSFDQVQQSMNIMKNFDPTYGGAQKITLTGESLQRYIDVGLRISCEFCCGAKAIIDKNGQAACGCAHSQAMRGLAAYLIQKHGSEFSNDEILRELARWKGAYFPKQMIKKISEQLQNGQFTPDIAALVLNLKMPKYGASSASAPLPSEIKDLPGMVGGC